MSGLTTDFLESRRGKTRAKRIILAGTIFGLLAAFAGGIFYWRQKPRTSAANLSPAGQVAGSESSKIPAEWLMRHFGTSDLSNSAVGGEEGDPDGDILTNYQEYVFGTNPNKYDSDNDGESDGMEVAFGQNPDGEGMLPIAEKTEEYIQSLGSDYEDFTQEKITSDVEKFFGADRVFVPDLPPDSELKIISQNDEAAFEKYYADTIGLQFADEEELKRLEAGFLSLAPEEAANFSAKLEAALKVLKATPVPSDLVNIHKLKIAQLKAGIAMFDLLKNGSYREGEDNQQFWQDFFYQTVVAEQAAAIELAAWKELTEKMGIK